MSTDEAKKKTTCRTEVSGKRTRATLGNRFHRDKARSTVSGLGCIATTYAQLLQQSKKTLRKNEKHLCTRPTPEAKASKAPTRLGQLGWAILWMTQLLCSGAASVNPHQPVKITWKLQNGLTREVLNSTTTIHPPNTRWPDLYFDLKPVVNVPCKRGKLPNHAFWACPGAPRHN